MASRNKVESGNFKHQASNLEEPSKKLQTSNIKLQGTLKPQTSKAATTALEV